MGRVPVLHGFGAFYCIPGIDGATEKGGVEGEVCWFPRNHLVPVPVVDTLAELNARLELAGRKEDARRIENPARTVGQDFALEAPLLRPLPADPFDEGLWLTPRVDRYSRVTARQCHYSVPAKLIGRTVRVSLRASEVVILDGKREVARPPPPDPQERPIADLDHYLGCWPSSPARCPARPRWLRPAPRGCPPPSTRRSGPQPAPRTATPAAVLSRARARRRRRG